MLTQSFSKTLIALSLCAGFGVSASAFAEPAGPNDPVAHSDSAGAAATDTVITAKVKARLMKEHSLKKSDISVTTTNGVVTLNGSVTSAHAKHEAAEESKAVDGVVSVDNQLMTPKSSKQPHKAMSKTKRVASDSWITTKVKSELLADSMSKGFKVNVVTTHGVVVLEGSLTSQDAIDHVKDIASKVDGVKSVDISGLTVATK